MALLEEQDLGHFGGKTCFVASSINCLDNETNRVEKIVLIIVSFDLMKLSI
jgi:hypothetical protein